jgi:hypothetical protein
MLHIIKGTYLSGIASLDGLLHDEPIGLPEGPSRLEVWVLEGLLGAGPLDRVPPVNISIVECSDLEIFGGSKLMLSFQYTVFV